MHELALVEGVVDAVTRAVGDRRVRKVRVVVGSLVAVVPDAMRFCFEICARATPLEGAQLEIVEIRARGRCRSCGDEIELPEPVPLCPCGGADVEILTGNELLIRDVEVI